MKPTSKEVINELSKILDATPKEIKGFITPKEKAQKLVSSMYNSEYCDIEHFPNKKYCECSEINWYQSKQCALIAVDMVIKCCKDYDEVHENYTTQVDYWIEVKREIEKL